MESKNTDKLVNKHRLQKWVTHMIIKFQQEDWCVLSFGLANTVKSPISSIVPVLQNTFSQVTDTLGSL